MRRFRLLTMALTVLATLAVATPAQAAEPVHVDLIACYYFGGGEIEVPRHTDIYLDQAWITKSRLQGLEFLVSVKPHLKIDGVKVTQANHYWSMPVKIDDHLWATPWSYPAGRLSRGESLEVKLQVTLRERVWDGFGWTEAGPVFDPKIACKVTAK